MGLPQNGWFKNPSKMDDLGVPPFWETSICDSRPEVQPLLQDTLRATTKERHFGNSHFVSARYRWIFHGISVVRQIGFSIYIKKCPPCSSNKQVNVVQMQKMLLWLWVKTWYPGEAQNSIEMDVHPPKMRNNYWFGFLMLNLYIPTATES